MKAFVIIIIFLFASMLSAQEYGWVDISGNIEIESDNYGFIDVFFINENEGWIAPFGNFSNGEEIYGLYHTTDGGNSYEFISTDGQVYAIHFLDSQTGYIGMREGRVYYTADGGKNWTLLFPLTGSPVIDIDFPHSGNTGFCCGFDGSMHILTSNSTEKIETQIASSFSGVSCISGDEAWAVAEGSLIHIKNKQNIEDQGLPSGTYCSIQMYDDKIGWSCGSKHVTTEATNGMLNKTEDGKIWINVLTLGERTVLTTLHFFNKEIGWAGGYNGVIVSTSDAGETWAVDSSFTTDNFKFFWEKIFFTSENNGFVVGAESGEGQLWGRIYKYTQITSINEEADSEPITIYPNPALDLLIISIATKPNSNYEISAINGNVMLKGNLPESKTIDISGLQPGAYLLRILSGDEHFKGKFVVE